MTKIAASFWRATTRRVVELATVPYPFDLIKDGLLRIAAEQEVGVQRVWIAAGDRPLRGDQGLREHLAAKHPPPAVVRREANEAVLSRGREIEERDKINSLHEGVVPVRPDGEARNGPRQRGGRPPRHARRGRARLKARAGVSALWLAS